MDGGTFDFDRWSANHEARMRAPRARGKAQYMKRATGIQPYPCPCGVAKVHMHHLKFDLYDLRELAVADRVAFP